jgi:hypothetical protein
MCKQEGYTHILVISSRWYTPAEYCYLDKGEVGCIGIVTVGDNITGQIKQYIGLGKGENREFDEDLIIAGGSRFYGV